MIELKHITFRYKNGLKVIDDLSISLPSKGLYLLKGKSGRGKSTLLNIINLSLKDFKGEYLFDGEDIKSKFNNNKEIRHYFFSFTQDFSLFKELKVKDYLNLFIEFNGDNIKEIDKTNLLNKVNLDASYLNRKMDTLSKGEEERVAFCSALISKSKVLLLDEPLSNLDKENYLILVPLIEEISKEKLVLISLHKFEYFDKFDGIIDLDNPKNECQFDNDAALETESTRKTISKFSLIKYSFKGVFYKFYKKIAYFLLNILFFALSIASLSSILYTPDVFKEKYISSKNPIVSLRSNNSEFDDDDINLLEENTDNPLYVKLETDLSFAKILNEELLQNYEENKFILPHRVINFAMPYEGFITNTNKYVLYGDKPSFDLKDDCIKITVNSYFISRLYAKSEFSDDEYYNILKSLKDVVFQGNIHKFKISGIIKTARFAPYYGGSQEIHYAIMQDEEYNSIANLSVLVPSSFFADCNMPICGAIIEYNDYIKNEAKLNRAFEVLYTHQYYYQEFQETTYKKLIFWSLLIFSFFIIINIFLIYRLALANSKIHEEEKSYLLLRSFTKSETYLVTNFANIVIFIVSLLLSSALCIGISPFTNFVSNFFLHYQLNTYSLNPLIAFLLIFASLLIYLLFEVFCFYRKKKAGKLRM